MIVIFMSTSLEFCQSPWTQTGLRYFNHHRVCASTLSPNTWKTWLNRHHLVSAVLVDGRAGAILPVLGQLFLVPCTTGDVGLGWVGSSRNWTAQGAVSLIL